jgi:hypothetical protein
MKTMLSMSEPILSQCAVDYAESGAKSPHNQIAATAARSNRDRAVRALSSIRAGRRTSSIIRPVAAIVQILSLYVGDNEVARHNRAAGPLLLPGGMAAHLARSLRDGVLNRQAGFRGKVEIEGLPPLDVEWIGAAGQTAGVAVWFRGGLVGSVSILLSGLEDARERGEVLGALAARRLPVPPDIHDTLDQFPRPLLVNVHYTLASQTDPVTGTLAPMLAHAFFAMLGINVEDT